MEESPCWQIIVAKLPEISADHRVLEIDFDERCICLKMRSLVVLSTSMKMRVDNIPGTNRPSCNSFQIMCQNDIRVRYTASLGWPAGAQEPR